MLVKLVKVIYDPSCKIFLAYLKMLIKISKKELIGGPSATFTSLTTNKLIELSVYDIGSLVISSF